MERSACHPILEMGAGTSLGATSGRKRKGYFEAAIFKTVVTWSNEPQGSHQIVAPDPSWGCPANLPKSSGLRLRVRMK